MFQPHDVAWDADKVDRFWQHYPRDDFFSASHTLDLAEILVRAAGSGPIADIGCGEGHLASALVKRDVDVIGIDGSPLLIERARARVPDAKFFTGSVIELPLPDDSVSGASLVEVVEHLDDRTLTAALFEAKRVIQPGGSLLVTTPHREDLEAVSIVCPDCGAKFHPVQHVRSWTTDTLRQALRAAGFNRGSIRPTKLVPDGAMVGRLVRRALYRVRADRPHLVAVAVKGPER